MTEIYCIIQIKNCTISNNYFSKYKDFHIHTHTHILIKWQIKKKNKNKILYYYYADNNHN